MTATTPAIRMTVAAQRPHPQRWLHVGWLQDAVLWLVGLQRRHRERMQLAEMDAAALKDIGLSRCDVMAELCKPRWRR